MIFAGTTNFAAAILADILATQELYRHQIVAVYTKPDSKLGRGRKLSINPVKQLALQQQISIEQPDNFKNPQSITTLRNYYADLMIVVAYGLILPVEVLSIPKLGCINVHASLLPRWRGAAPIQQAIIHGDQQTGVCIMQMNEGLDTGDILLSNSCEIAADDTTDSLANKLQIIASKLIKQILAKLPDLPNKIPQSSQNITYADKITKTMAKINWQHSALQIDRFIRGFIPAPVAYSLLDDIAVRIWQTEVVQLDNNQVKSAHPGQITKVDKTGIQVACADNQLKIVKLQLPGGKILAVKDILNGKHKQLFVVGNKFN